MKLALAFLLATFALPLAAAQTPADPLVERVQEKAAQAQADPVGYAQNQTTPTQIQRDANWTVAYACDVARDAGVDPPDVGVCPERPDAIATEPDNETVAIAEPLRNDTLALVDDAVGTVGDIVEDPEDAPEEAVDFLKRVVRFLADAWKGVADGLSTAFGAIVDALGAAVDGLTRGLGAAGEGIRSAWLAVSGALVNGWNATVDAVASCLDAVGDALDSTGDALADGTKAAVDAVVEATDAVADRAGDLVRSLLGQDAPTSQPEPPLEVPEPTQLPQTGDVTDLLDEALPL